MRTGRFSVRRSTFRRKPRTFWIRQTVNNAAPAALTNIDLMTGYLTTAGLTAQANEMVLYRLHLKISATFTSSAVGANNGIGVAVWVDSRNQAQLVFQGFPYDQQWLIFDNLYESETRMQGGVTPFNVVRDYDVKARRKIPGLTDTLWMQVNSSGFSTISGYSYIISALIRST